MTVEAKNAMDQFVNAYLDFFRMKNPTPNLRRSLMMARENAHNVLTRREYSCTVEYVDALRARKLSLDEAKVNQSGSRISHGFIRTAGFAAQTPSS